MEFTNKEIKSPKELSNEIYKDQDDYWGRNQIPLILENQTTIMLEMYKLLHEMAQDIKVIKSDKHY